MKEIKDFCVSSNANGFDEFLKVLKEYFKLHLSGRTQKYYGVEDGIFSMWSSIPNVIEVAPQEAIALLTGKQLTEGDLIVGNRFECIKNVYSAGDILLFKKGSVYKCNDRQELIGEIIRVFYGDRIKYLNKEFKLLPTQESVKERNGDPSMYDMIQLVEQLESDKFHLQQQLNTLTSEIKRFQEKYDENGYDCSNEIKLLRIENHIDSTLSFYHKEVTDLQQQLKEAKELLEESFPIIQAAITLLRVAPNNNTLPEPPHDVIKLVKSINQFLTRNK